MITVLNQPLIKEFPGFIYEQGRPSWLKSTSVTLELREFLLRGAQNMPWSKSAYRVLGPGSWVRDPGPGTRDPGPNKCPKG